MAGELGLESIAPSHSVTLECYHQKLRSSRNRNSVIPLELDPVAKGHALDVCSDHKTRKAESRIVDGCAPTSRKGWPPPVTAPPLSTHTAK